MARSRWGNGIDEMTCSAGSSRRSPWRSVTTEVARPSPWWISTTRVSITSSPPSASTRSRQRSHIIPGPYLGYWNSSMRLVSWLDLLRRPNSLARIGSHSASTSDMPLMRWAAKSAEIDDAGTPQSFSL